MTAFDGHVVHSVSCGWWHTAAVANPWAELSAATLAMASAAALAASDETVGGGGGVSAMGGGAVGASGPLSQIMANGKQLLT